MNLSRADLELLHHLLRDQEHRMDHARRRKPPDQRGPVMEEIRKVNNLAGRLHQALQA